MLLDAVYRSIDRGEDHTVIFRKPITADDANVRASMMIGKRMEIKKVITEKVVDRTKPAPDLQANTWREGRRHNSSSSFSDPSGGVGGGGLFSFSEAESFSGERHYNKQKTSKKHEGSGLLKTKSRVLKMYGDLKKVKQPISPGGKLAGFLNSLFTAAGNSKKPNDSPPPKMTSTSASRSCLIHTPPSSSGAKRSVRFSAVEEDEYSLQPRGQKWVHEENHNIDMIKTAIIEELVEHKIMKKNGLMGCDLESSPSSTDQLRKNKDFKEEEEEEDDDFDGASYASSDLFELDNLNTAAANIEMERYSSYREELPVYETTHLHANRPIF